MQDVICAAGCPQSKEPMVGVRERAPPSKGDQPGIAVLGEDHLRILWTRVWCAAASANEATRPRPGPRGAVRPDWNLGVALVWYGRYADKADNPK